MTASEARQLREAWKGGECNHPKLEREVHDDETPTSMFVCTRCGGSCTGGDADAFTGGQRRLWPY